mgnify:CR=1 FL=1
MRAPAPPAPPASLSLLSLSLHENSHLSSIEGLQSCSRLWTVDLRGCALTSIQPILHLGALSELHLGGNRISLAAALKLRCMAIGRLGLQGNPLLDPTRLGASAGHEAHVERARRRGAPAPS